LAIGGVRSKFFKEAAAEYEKRLKPFARLRITELKSTSFGVSDKERAKAKEMERLVSVLEKEEKNKVCLLDAAGDKLDSDKFAELVDSIPGVVFVVGGSLGFSDELKKKYRRISLTSLTLPHELARVVLLEQLYRAAAKLRGKTYDY
jgi:23S rRNA (pseudouridine1915-N3)-methyltransferase